MRQNVIIHFTSNPVPLGPTSMNVKIIIVQEHETLSFRS